MTSFARASAVVIALLCASVAHAAVVTPVPKDVVVKLMRGSSQVTRDPRTVTATNPSGDLLPALTHENCPGIRDALYEFEGLTRTTGASVYKCVAEQRAMVTFKANTCPPLPSPEGKVVVCPVGATGAFTQTKSWSAAPYPTCQTEGAWEPAVPTSQQCPPIDTDNDGVPDQADECPTVHAQTPNGCPATPPEPPSTDQWTFCANEWGTCEFSGTRRVRYGAGSTWVERDVTAIDAGVACRNSVFGDPIPGLTKRCELRSDLPQPEPAGTGTLPWTAPTTNTDGSPLTDLAGYRVVWGQDPSALTNVQQVLASATSYTVTGLAAGTWHFAVKAFTTDGRESALSAVRSKVVQ